MSKFFFLREQNFLDFTYYPGGGTYTPGLHWKDREERKKKKSLRTTMIPCILTELLWCKVHKNAYVSIFLEL